MGRVWLQAAFILSFSVVGCKVWSSRDASYETTSMTAQLGPGVGAVTAKQHCCHFAATRSFKNCRLAVKATRSMQQRCHAAAAEQSSKPILLFDVMDTLVWDPFYTAMPEFFDMKLPDLLKAKDPHAWPDFERGKISEEELYTNFFKDRRPIDSTGLLQQMINGYRWIDGIEQLLLDLDKSGAEMHIITNYPMWYKRIEDKLAVSRHLPWTFVSCEGPMKGLRKPEAECYEAVAAHLGVEPQRITLIDDRQVNVVGALEQGWNVHLFQNVPALRKDLRKKRILRNMAGPFDPPPPTMIR